MFKDYIGQCCVELQYLSFISLRVLSLTLHKELPVMAFLNKIILILID